MQDSGETCRETLAYTLTRVIVIALIYLLALVLPEIDIILEIGGAVLGTIINIVIPTLFYNRAYSGE